MGAGQTGAGQTGAGQTGAIKIALTCFRSTEITEKSDALVSTKKTTRMRSFAPLALAWSLMMEDESLDEEDKRILERFGIKYQDVLKARALVLDFLRLLKAKESDRPNA